MLAFGSRPQSGVLTTSMDSSKGFQPPFVFGPYEADISSGNFARTAHAPKFRTCHSGFWGCLLKTRDELLLAKNYKSASGQKIHLLTSKMG